MVQRSEGRKKNLEELRCLAMMMVVVLHFLGKGELLGDVTASGMSAAGVAAWIAEAFCIVAVNVYMLISGYFLCESSFKLSRLLKLYLQIWMYSVGVGIVTGLLWPASVEADIHYFLSLLCPISMGHYWFMTAYVFLYLLLPLVGKAVKKMTQGQLKLVLTLLLFTFCILKSILPFRLEEDGMGYDALWYLCVFLVAAYIRKFGISFLQKAWHCALLYIGGVAAVLAELFLLRYVFLRAGSFGLILKISFEYNHVWVLLASVGLFGWFLCGKGEGFLGKWAEKAAPYVLGVYLLHENLGIRYEWPALFGAGRIQNVPQLLLGVAAAVLCAFITGVIVERLRSLAVNLLGKALSRFGWWRSLCGRIARVDEMFAEK
ncbi:MAG: acyltransferase [Clostridium sp.]|nr:acyltransferase [Acetatifactor muris]MCM1527004.1 acyltransferase [Bacteroides sp.]MCM1563167.1 acyltransferase [Clostridium sp.]